MDNFKEYQKIFKLEDSKFVRIMHEDAASAHVYKIIQPNGTELILKMYARHHDYLREIYFLTYLKDKIFVPKIINTVTQTDNLHAALLRECLPGHILKSFDVTTELAYQSGVILAQIHNNRLAAFGDPTRPSTLTINTRIYFEEKFNEYLQECTGHLDPEIIEKCKIYYATHASLLDKVDGPCIVHRDFRPGNIIAFDNNIQGVIDWASARAGFAEEDLCTLEHHVWSEPKQANNKASFFKGYTSIRALSQNNLALISLLRLAHALNLIGFSFKHKIWNTIHKQSFEANLTYIKTNT